MRRPATLLLLMALLATACGGSQQGSAEASALQPGDEAPGFTLPSASGGRVTLSDFVRKPVLLYFSMGPG